MDRPQHELLGVASKNKQGRVTGLVVVIGLHAVIITALVLGMTNNQLRKDVLDISASVIGKKAAEKAPPPPPPALVRPPPTIAAPPPQIVIAAPPPPPPVVKAPVVVAPVEPPTPPKEIAKTHTIPPYPALSQRLGEQGTTSLKVTVGTDGKPTEVVVTKSSGSTRLDAAALQYVKENYTWVPATREGKPIVDTTQVDIVWDLKNAQ
jgi:periplasmic protein TonB